MKLLANPFMTICSVEHDIYTLTSVFIFSLLFAIHFPGADKENLCTFAILFSTHMINFFPSLLKTKSTVKLFFVQLTVSICQLLGLTLFAVFRPTVNPMETLREPKIIPG